MEVTHCVNVFCFLTLFFSRAIIFSEKPDVSLYGVADASMYAHYLFNAFDTTNNGSIKFKVSKK